VVERRTGQGKRRSGGVEDARAEGGPTGSAAATQASGATGATGRCVASPSTVAPDAAVAAIAGTVSSLAARPAASASAADVELARAVAAAAARATHPTCPGRSPYRCAERQHARAVKRGAAGVVDSRALCAPAIAAGASGTTDAAFAARRAEAAVTAVAAVARDVVDHAPSRRVAAATAEPTQAAQTRRSPPLSARTGGATHRGGALDGGLRHD
jgi:hypothetical protein